MSSRRWTSITYSLPFLPDLRLPTGRKGGDILVVEGGDEGLVEGAHGLVGVLVPKALEVLDLPLTRREVHFVVEGLFEKVGSADERRSLMLEEVVEALLP